MAAWLAVTVWGFGPLYVKAIDASFQAVVFWRVGLAVPVMIAMAVATGGREVIRPLRAAVLPGVLFSAAMICSFASFKKTSLVNATMIGSLSPALAMIGGWMVFGERLGRRRLVLAFAALCSLIVLVVAGGGTTGRAAEGDIYAVLNLLSWTCYVLLSKRVRNSGVHAWSYLAAVFSVMAAIVCPWALLTSDDVGGFDAKDWLMISLMVFLSGVVGHGLSTWALRHMTVSLWSLLGLVSPIISVVGAWVFFGQGLNLWQVFGALGVLASLVAVVRSSGVANDSANRVAADECLDSPASAAT